MATATAEEQEVGAPQEEREVQPAAAPAEDRPLLEIPGGLSAAPAEDVGNRPLLEIPGGLSAAPAEDVGNRPLLEIPGSLSAAPAEDVGYRPLLEIPGSLSAAPAEDVGYRPLLAIPGSLSAAPAEDVGYRPLLAIPTGSLSAAPTEDVGYRPSYMWWNRTEAEERERALRIKQDAYNYLRTVGMGEHLSDDCNQSEGPFGRNFAFGWAKKRPSATATATVTRSSAMIEEDSRLECTEKEIPDEFEEGDARHIEIPGEITNPAKIQAVEGIAKFKGNCKAADDPSRTTPSGDREGDAGACRNRPGGSEEERRLTVLYRGNSYKYTRKNDEGTLWRCRKCSRAFISVTFDGKKVIAWLDHSDKTCYEKVLNAWDDKPKLFLPDGRIYTFPLAQDAVVYLLCLDDVNKGHTTPPSSPKKKDCDEETETNSSVQGLTPPSSPEELEDVILEEDVVLEEDEEEDVNLEENMEKIRTPKSESERSHKWKEVEAIERPPRLSAPKPQTKNSFLGLWFLKDDCEIDTPEMDLPGRRIGQGSSHTAVSNYQWEPTPGTSKSSRPWIEPSNTSQEVVPSTPWVEPSNTSQDVVSSTTYEPMHCTLQNFVPNYPWDEEDDIPLRTLAPKPSYQEKDPEVHFQGCTYQFVWSFGEESVWKCTKCTTGTVWIPLDGLCLTPATSHNLALCPQTDEPAWASPYPYVIYDGKWNFPLQHKVMNKIKSMKAYSFSIDTDIEDFNKLTEGEEKPALTETKQDDGSSAIETAEQKEPTFVEPKEEKSSAPIETMKEE